MVWWCFLFFAFLCFFCGGVFVVVFLRFCCGGVVVFLLWCGGVFLWWCGGVFVLVRWCFCGGVFVVVFLWHAWCSQMLLTHRVLT